MNYKESFPNMADFLDTAFHQEGLAVLYWQGREPNDRDAAQFYKTLYEPEDILKITQELRKFLKLPLADEEIQKILRRFGVAYNPTYDGETFRDWLGKILDILEDPKADTSYLRFKSVAN
jgi:hypothetical protein